jgi:hypothetical protein
MSKGRNYAHLAMGRLKTVHSLCHPRAMGRNPTHDDGAVMNGAPGVMRRPNLYAGGIATLFVLLLVFSWVYLEMRVTRHLPATPPGWQYVRAPLVVIAQPGQFVINRYLLESSCSWTDIEIIQLVTDWIFYFLLLRGMLWVLARRRSEARP